MIFVKLLKFKLRKPFILVINLFVGVLISMLTPWILNYPFKNWLTVFSIIVILMFFFHLLVIKLSGINLFSLSFFFVLLSYTFHFGQTVMMGFLPEYEYQRFNVVFAMDRYYIKQASAYSLVVICAVVVGIVASKSFSIRELKYRNRKDDNNLCKKIGWIFVFCTFPIRIYLDIVRITISLKIGYLATYQTGIAGIWGVIANFSFIGWAFLIMGYKNQKKKSIAFFVIIVAYLILTMLTGNRGMQSTFIILYFFLFHKIIMGISWKKIIITIFIGILLIVLINTFLFFRAEDDKTLSAFATIFLNQLRTNPINALVFEMGGTIKTPTLVIEQIPSYRPHSYGTTYLLSFFSVLPDVGNLFSNFNLKASFTKNILGHALGGSFIGELYYNFSYFGIFFGLLIGLFVASISNRVETLIKRKNYLRVGYYVPLFVEILWWPRDTFQSLLRPFIWGAIAIYFLKLVIRGINNKFDSVK